jgi:glycosyltransferase involved in cell wall biosynthesis
MLRDLGRDVRLIDHARRFSKDAAQGFDCVYERSGYLLSTGLKFARAAEVPYVLETDGMLVDARRAAYGAPLWRLGERVERRKHRAADLLVVMSEAMSDVIARRYELKPDRVFVKGLGVEETLLAEAPEDPPDRFLVGFAGTFQPYHGVELLVEAAGLLPEAEFILVGDGPGFAAARAGAPDNVSFLGQRSRDETLDMLSRARVLVIPASAPAMYPVKFLEYAALRRPIVCPDYPTYDEFDSGRAQSAIHRFRAGSAEGLANALRRGCAASENEPLDDLRSLVAERYTWRSIGERLAVRLQELVAA